MKYGKVNFSTVNRLPVVLSVLESLCLGWALTSASYIGTQPISANFSQRVATSMTMCAVQILLLEPQVIYQNDAASKDSPKLKKHGFSWFLSLYSLHVVSSFLVDVRCLFWENGKWLGLLLFLLKLAVVCYMGMMLRAAPAGENPSESTRTKDVPSESFLDTALLLTTIFLLVADIFLPTLFSMHSPMMLLSGVVMAFYLFRLLRHTPKAES